MILHETLTSDLITAGARLVHFVNQAGVPIAMAVWKRDYDYGADRQGPWELFLAVSLPETDYDEWRKQHHKVWAVYNNHRQKLFPLDWMGVRMPPPPNGDLFRQFHGVVKSCRDQALAPDYSSEWADGVISGDHFIYIAKE